MTSEQVTIGRKKELEFFYGKCKEFIIAQLGAMTDHTSALEIATLEEQLLWNRHHEALDIPTFRMFLKGLRTTIDRLEESISNMSGVSPELLARIEALEEQVASLSAATSLQWIDTTTQPKTLYGSTQNNTAVIEQEATGIAITYQIPAMTLSLTAETEPEETEEP